MARAFTILTFAAGGAGLTQSFTIPIDTRAVAFKADGNVWQHPESGKGSNFWPVSQGGGESVIARGDESEILYFTGDEGSILYIKTITGLGA